MDEEEVVCPFIPPHPCPPFPPHPPRCSKEELLEKLQDSVAEAISKAKSARNYGTLVYNKLAKVIIDPDTSAGKEAISNMIEKTGKETLVESIIRLCEQLETGDGVNITYEAVINALGYVPAAEGGSNYVVGFILD